MLDIEPENSPGATLRRMLILLLAAVVMAFGIAARADSIRLYDQVGVNGSTVTLRDIAELNGPSAQALADTVLMSLEDGRGEYTITLDSVEQALDKAGANWGLISLRGVNACRVTRLAEPPRLLTGHGQDVTANIETPIGLGTTLTLRAMAEQYLAERAGVGHDELRVTFSERDAKRLDIPVLGRSIEFEPTSLNNLGRVPLIVRLYEGRSVAETMRINAQAERSLLAVVTTGPIARGEVFTRDKLQVREFLLDDDNLAPVTDPSIVIGQESVVSLRAGDMVTVRSVRAPIMVKRGQLVDVRCFVGGLVIRTVGHATEDGSLDDRVLVRSESTGDTFYALVTGRQEVVVATDSDTQTEATTAMASRADQEAMN